MLAKTQDHKLSRPVQNSDFPFTGRCPLWTKEVLSLDSDQFDWIMDFMDFKCFHGLNNTLYRRSLLITFELYNIFLMLCDPEVHEM